MKDPVYNCKRCRLDDLKMAITTHFNAFNSNKELWVRVCELVISRMTKCIEQNSWQFEPGMWKQLFHQPLPHLSLLLPLTKNEKTTVHNFLNFCGSVACLLLYSIILRRQKPIHILLLLYLLCLSLLFRTTLCLFFLRY